MKNTYLSLLLCIIGLGVTTRSIADVYVIVHEDSNVASLSQDQVRDLFFGRHIVLNGEKLSLEAYDVYDTKLRSQFYKAISGKSLRQMNSYWARLVFSGRGRPPEKKSPESVVNAVSETAGVIGYVASEQLFKEQPVKVIYHAQ